MRRVKRTEVLNQREKKKRHKTRVMSPQQDIHMQKNIQIFWRASAIMERSEDAYLVHQFRSGRNHRNSKFLNQIGKKWHVLLEDLIKQPQLLVYLKGDMFVHVPHLSSRFVFRTAYRDA